MVLMLFKSQCVLCDSKVGGKISLCSDCRAELAIVDYSCEACALPLVNNESGSLCGQCIAQAPVADYAINLFQYISPVDYLISQMKFHQQFSVVAVLADLLKTHVNNIDLAHGFPDAFLPVPLHKKRLVKRGFNQALEIIKPLAIEKDIPILLDVISRTKETRPQTNLNKVERKSNMSGCFTLNKCPEMSHIVIVDDVVTTGATTNELAKLLKKSGVKKVGVWSLARAELN